jgi:hypothetical protein
MIDIYAKELILSSNGTHWLQGFLNTFFSVLFTASIAWIVYRQKEKENRIKQEINNFYLIGFYLISNLENLNVLREKNIKTALAEIDKVVDALKNVQYLVNCYKGKETFITKLNFTDATSLKKHIRKLIADEEKKLKFEVAYQSIITYIKEKDLEENTLFLASYGNKNFQRLYKLIELYFILTNKCINIVNDYIKSIEVRVSEKQETIFDINHPDSNIKIDEKINEYLYFRNLYSNLLITIENALFYGIMLLDHLSAFSHHYSIKYNHILSALNIKFNSFELKNIMFEIEDLKSINLENNSFNFLWAIPLYTNMKRNLADKIASIFYPSYWLK